MKETSPSTDLFKRGADFIDRAVDAIAPRYAFKRRQARQAMQVLDRFNKRNFQNSSYRGAESNRLRGDWSVLGGSADADLLTDLPTLRNRSRDLNRSSAHAAAITSTVCVNVIGTGLKPQSRINRRALSVTDGEAEAFQFAAERAWSQWVPHADAGNRMDFMEMESLIQRQILENGEVLILPLRVNEPQRSFMLALEIIEADRLETPPGLHSKLNIRDGVELGSRGEPVAYYIRRNHPGDYMLGKSGVSRDFIRYPAMNPTTGAKNIFHLYHMKRAGQSRGEPFFAPVMTAFKDLADYIEATEVAARIAACFAGFITKADPYSDGVVNTDDTDSSGKSIQEIEPGMLERLGPGEKIDFANPQRVDSAFEPFVLAMLRSIGAALGLPLELVLKDFSRTNYSSARASLLEARRFFKYYQQWMIRRLCQPVYEMVIEEAWLQGQIPSVNLFGDQREDWTRTIWIAPGWGWVDPKKEIEASLMAVNGNLSTLADENAAQGRDWEETLDQREREVRVLEEKGITVPEPTGTIEQDQPEDQPAVKA